MVDAHVGIIMVQGLCTVWYRCWCMAIVVWYRCWCMVDAWFCTNVGAWLMHLLWYRLMVWYILGRGICW
jgi:hypothetical protein